MFWNSILIPWQRTFNQYFSFINVIFYMQIDINRNKVWCNYLMISRKKHLSIFKVSKNMSLCLFSKYQFVWFRHFDRKVMKIIIVNANILRKGGSDHRRWSRPRQIIRHIFGFKRGKSGREWPRKRPKWLRLIYISRQHSRIRNQTKRRLSSRRLQFRDRRGKDHRCSNKNVQPRWYTNKQCRHLATSRLSQDVWCWLEVDSEGACRWRL